MIRFASLALNKKIFSLSPCRHPRRGSSDFNFQFSDFNAKGTGRPAGMTNLFRTKFSASIKQSGFSLIEMAIVLVILGFIMGGVVGGLSSQREVQKRNDVNKQLEEIRSAVIGFAQINNRLPCPASPISRGQSVPQGAGACTGNNSFVPYVDLGIQGAAPNGVLLDTWLEPIRYRVTSSPANLWFYTTGIIGFQNNPAPNLNVCRTVPCPAPTSPDILATNVVAVFFSTGDPLSPSVNTAATATTTDYRSTEPTAAFDDTLIWLSQPELVYALSKTR